MEERLKLIDFKDFPVDDRFAQIEGKLFVADNFDINNEFDHPQIQMMKAPVQLSMNIIFMCISGSMKIKVNLQDYTLNRGGCITLMTGSFMQIIDISYDFKGSVIAIASDFMNFGDDVKMGLAIQQHTSDQPYYKLEEQELEEALVLYRMMKAKLINKDFIYKVQVAKAYLDLFKYNGFQAFYMKSKIEEHPSLRNRKTELFDNFIKAVQTHYKQERQVLFYADLLCISPKYLSSIIHDVSGKYATQWIDDYVVLNAKALLKNSSISIKEVCIQLNFTNQSLFAKYFKKHTGMTPKEFRKS